MSHQPCVGPNDEPPVGIAIAHDVPQPEPDTQERQAQQQAPQGAHEASVAVHADMDAKVGRQPEEALLALSCCLLVGLRFLQGRTDRP